MADSNGVEVALVCMPIAAVERPSIALGQLQTSLLDAGISARSHYPNLMFLDYVGIEDYALFDITRVEDCLGDWMFAHLAFPELDVDDNRYIDRLLARNKKLAEALGDGAHAKLFRMRGMMDGFLDWAVNSVLADEPKMVGATSTFQQHIASLALLRRIRERAPGIVTMMGGANCETVMGRATHRRYPWVDFVVSGEADGLIAPMCRDILEHGRDIDPDILPFGVLAPGHREQGYPAGNNADGVPRAITENIADVPLPHYEDYFAALDKTVSRSLIKPGLSVETARGCWWGERQHCLFCGLNGGSMAFRAKSAEDVISDFESLKSRYGMARFEAVDNIMAAGYFDTVIPAITGRGYDVFYETKANLRPHEVEQLAKAGVRWIQPGIENLDTRVLKLMRKGVTAWNNIRLLRSCRQHGLRMSWTILCGFPGEEDSWYSDMATIMPALTHFQPGGMSMLRFDRYSPYFDEAEKYGLNLRPSELYQYVYPESEEDLAEQVYFFEDRAMGDRGRGLANQRSANRPGLDAVRVEIVNWYALWEQQPPTLEMVDHGETLVVRDTRPVASRPEHRLEGLLRTVLLDAYDAVPRHRLVENLSGSDASAADVENAIAELCADHLAIDVDGRILSLPLQAPITPLASVFEFPGGFVHKPKKPQTASAKPKAA